MKIKLLVAAATAVVAIPAMAQPAFQGFYGQIATGHENNSASNLNITVPSPGQWAETRNANNQSFGGVPLVIGLGYNFSVAPKWLLGVGVDYSAISQKSHTYSSAIPVADGGTLSGQSLKLSNRFNIFLAPGYVIDKDKLVYLKAGYSGVKAKSNSPSLLTDSGGMTYSLASGSQIKNLSGYIVGLGYKQMISGSFYGFAEADYMSYSKSTFSAGTVAGSSNASVNPGLSSYQALVGIGYRF